MNRVFFLSLLLDLSNRSATNTGGEIVMEVSKVTDGGQKGPGKFPSIKCNLMILWESKLELDYFLHLLLQGDRDVVT